LFHYLAPIQIPDQDGVMRPLSEWTPASDPKFNSRNILAFDLDDTLTEDSELMASALAALKKSHAAGLRNVLVTGRPASWADALLRLLPFEAAVAENGSVVFWKDPVRIGNVERLYWESGHYVSHPPTRETQAHLLKLSEDVLARFPKFLIATDQVFRLYDIAFDFAEACRPALALSEAQALADYCESLGFSAKVSNIHVNVWKGNFTKIEGLRCLVEGIWRSELKKNVIYTGDSPNDGPLFGVVDISVGVANVHDFIKAGVSFTPPQFVTRAAFGDGATELIEHRLRFMRALP
jgi:HAD superfamily hydrolase (TIGR01484 family)